MARFILTFATATAILCMAAGPEPGATTKPDKQRIQGQWKWMMVLDQGVTMPWPEGNRLVITADLIKITYPKDDARGWKYTIDSSKDPKEMDWFVEEEPGHPIHQTAIYSLDGDTLKICSTAAGKPRPTKFESKRGDFGGLWILQRVAPSTTKEGGN